MLAILTYTALSVNPPFVHADLDAFGVAEERGSRANLERGSGFGLEALHAL